MLHFKDAATEMTYETLGAEQGPVIVWAHGWGQSHIAFKSLAASMEKLGRHVLIDFPGFGQSPPPSEIWGTEEYAAAMAEFIKSVSPTRPVIWAGHSFGCRVGLRLAAKNPDLVAGLFLVAAAGIPRQRSLMNKVYLKGRVALFKSLKKFIPLGLSEQWLYKIFGSADYRNAGPLRAIFVKVVNEDLSGILYKVRCPVQLVYGTNDQETPLELGERFHRIMRNSELLRLEGLDHYTVLTEGRHQVASTLKRFIERCGDGNV